MGVGAAKPLFSMGAPMGCLATIDHGLPLFGVAHGFLYDYFPFLFRSHLQMPVFLWMTALNAGTPILCRVFTSMAIPMFLKEWMA